MLDGGGAIRHPGHSFLHGLAGGIDLRRGEILVELDVDLVLAVAVGGVQQVGDGRGQAKVGNIHARHGVVGGNAYLLHAVHSHHSLHHLTGHVVGLVLREGIGGGEGDHGLVAGAGGQQHDAHGEHLPAAEHQQQHGGCQRHKGLFQRLFQTAAVGVLDLIEPCQLFGLGVLQHGSRGGGHHGQCHDQGSHQAVADAQGHGSHQAADHAGREHCRQEDAHRGKGRRHNGHTHLTRTLHRSAGGGHAAAAQTVDVLDDNDRVIHQHTDAQRKAGQRHDVQVQTGEVHQHHGKQHRQGDTDTDHQRRLDVLQEDGQHDNGQCSTHQHTGEDALDKDADVVALIGQHYNVQTIVLGFQLLETVQTVGGYVTCAGAVVLVNFQHRGLLAVQAGIAVGGVVDDLHVCHIGKAHVAVALHMEQQRAADILHAVVFLAHLQQPRLAVFVLDVTGGHGEILGVDQGRKGLDIQLLGHIGAGKRLFLGGLVLGLGLAELLFVLVQLLACLGKLHIGVELLLGKAAQCSGELAHHAGHIVHGLDGIFQCLIDDVQAVLQLQFVCQIRSALALRTRLSIDAVLQGLQGRGKLIGDIAQLGDDLDQGVDIPHTGVVELVHHPLQACLHLDQCLLHLGLLDHGDQIVDALQQCLGLLAHHLYGVPYLRAQGAHNRVGHGIAEVFELLIVFCAAGLDLGLGFFQLGVCRLQLGVDEFHQLFVDGIHLFLIQLHLHQLLHKAAGGYAGHAALALDVGGHGVLDKIRKLVHRTALAADSHGHKGVHVHAVLYHGRGQCRAGQIALGLIQLVGHLHHCAVHVRVIHKLYQQQAVVFSRGGGDLFHTGHRKRVLQHVRDFALHTLRAGTGIYGDHHQVRSADIRQQVGFHLGDRHKAEHQHHDDSNQHRKWFFDTEFFHLILPFLCHTARRNSSSLFGGNGFLTFLLYTQGVCFQ